MFENQWIILNLFLDIFFSSNFVQSLISGPGYPSSPSPVINTKLLLMCGSISEMNFSKALPSTQMILSFLQKRVKKKKKKKDNGGQDVKLSTVLTQ